MSKRQDNYVVPEAAYIFDSIKKASIHRQINLHQLMLKQIPHFEITDSDFKNYYKRMQKICQKINSIMDVNISVIRCNLCKSSPTTYYVSLGYMFNDRFICDKCVDGIKSYKARICNNCMFPLIKPFYEEKNYNIIGSTCDKCKKYSLKIKQQQHTDFYKMDFYSACDIDNYSDDESDMDSDSDNDSDSDSDSEGKKYCYIDLNDGHNNHTSFRDYFSCYSNIDIGLDGIDRERERYSD